MSDEITLYDIPSRGTPKSWSLNPWKARLVLNYKRIPYKTHWLEYPSIAPTLKSLNIPPNSPSVNPNAEYSCPAIKLADERYLQDSLAISHELEKLYPSPHPLKFDQADRAQTIINNLTKALFPIAIPRVMSDILNPISAEYFGPTRMKRTGGIPLPELAKSEAAGEAAWVNAREALEELKGLVNEREGVFVLGGDVEPSFADFVVVSCLRFFEIVDHEGDLFGRVMGSDESGGLKRLYRACKGWLERDD